MTSLICFHISLSLASVVMMMEKEWRWWWERDERRKTSNFDPVRPIVRLVCANNPTSRSISRLLCAIIDTFLCIPSIAAHRLPQNTAEMHTKTEFRASAGNWFVRATTRSRSENFLFCQFLTQQAHSWTSAIASPRHSDCLCLIKSCFIYT